MQEPGVCCDICSCSETILKIMRTPQQQRDEVLLRDHGGRAFHTRLRQGEEAATRDSGVTGVHVYKFRCVCSCCISSAGQLLNECLQILGEKLQQCRAWTEVLYQQIEADRFGDVSSVQHRIYLRGSSWIRPYPQQTQTPCCWDIAQGAEAEHFEATR